ncbi:deoxyribonuclease IV [Buchnera aphidicola]|uniref:Probable endonuclease 4 n=1 Tax=Buchnera aphidicola (Cinara cf. splendens/pseudotsugae 3390) TaxID=2518980 RepID=A0A451CWR4_9GAMM|nr:deoxyribonuclease IV [Buchnera aphidicola]VFP77663.1 Endonuclease 4 [Buchnera aphidicola (Cinara cf. splendens/pseudotsugae 3390)]
MKYIGAHVSTKGGLENSVLRAHQLGATAFSIFVYNPLRWINSPLQRNIIYNFRESCKIYHYSPLQILPHSSYLINLGHPQKELNKKSCETFIKEIKCCYELGLIMINIHPGSHLYQITEKKCLENISNSINFVLSKTRKIIVVLENTAGQGSNIGYCFEHLSFIINKIEDKSRIGVCLDTCHLFAAGYRLNKKNDFLETFKKFDSLIGFQYLSGIHINDSKGSFNSRLDRHHNLGYGKIKKNVFSWIVQIVEFKKIPMILETKDTSMWKNEICWLKKQSMLNSRKILNV